MKPSVTVSQRTELYGKPFQIEVNRVPICLTERKPTKQQLQQAIEIYPAQLRLIDKQTQQMRERQQG